MSGCANCAACRNCGGERDAPRRQEHDAAPVAAPPHAILRLHQIRPRADVPLLPLPLIRNAG